MADPLSLELEELEDPFSKPPRSLLRAHTIVSGNVVTASRANVKTARATEGGAPGCSEW